MPGITLPYPKYSGITNEQWVEATKAMYLFIQSDKVRYGAQIKNIVPDVVLGLHNFRTSLDKAYAILTNVQNRLNYDRNVRVRITGTQGQSNHQCDRSYAIIPDGKTVVMGTGRRVSTFSATAEMLRSHYATACPNVSSTISVMNETQMLKIRQFF